MSPPPYTTLLSRCLLVFLFWLAHSTTSLLLYLTSLPQTLASLLPSRTKLDLELVRGLDKLPKHVAFLVLEPFISPQDLARLVVWALTADIPHVTLYEPRGELKCRQVELLAAVRQQYQEEAARRPLNLAWRPHVRSETVIVSSGGKQMYPDRNGNCGGLQDEKVTVSLLSGEDGKPDIVSAARSLASRAREGLVRSEAVSENMVSNNLATNQGLPDPCLLVRFGEAASNGDFPPWQLRLTEMQQLPSHKGVTVEEWEKVLHKYGSCQQRCGK